MAKNKFSSLFEDVIDLNLHYKKIKESEKVNFNVFRILKLESSEVRTHSAFISELLNPKGSHGQNDTFLKLFIEIFCFKEKNIEAKSAKVRTEKHASAISEDRTRGGRVDIIITDKFQNKIVIENKIYAGDQAYQLVRYNNDYPNSDLIYLTLDGREPSVESRGELISGIDYKCYSYAENITEWLNQCIEKVVDTPTVREALTQYLNLIKYLTNQIQNNDMSEKLSSIIEANLEASFIVHDNFKTALIPLQRKLLKDLEQVAYELGLEHSFEFDFNQRYGGLWFKKNKWTHSWIGFQFQDYRRNLVYGIAVDKYGEYPHELQAELLRLSGGYGEVTEWWPLLYEMEEPYNNWDRFEPWQGIHDGTLVKILKSKIEEIMLLVGDTEL